MGIQQEKGGFALRGTISAMAESVAAFWKPMLVAAPVIGTALFFASGTNAQTSGSAAPSATTSASGPVAPIETAAAARRKGPKIKVKEASSDRVANPTPTTGPVAPIAAPEAARTGRPKVRDKTPMDTSRVENPTPATEPVAAPVAERTGRPKERDPTPTNDRVANPTPAPATERRRKGPKGDSSSDHQGRTSVTPLIIGALSAATALALVVSSGNDRPASP